MKYEVISLDVWGNARDGFIVNDAIHTGNYVEVDTLEHHKFFRSLKKQGIVDSYKGMGIDDISDDFHVYVYRRRDMKPLFDLEIVEG